MQKIKVDINYIGTEDEIEKNITGYYNDPLEKEFYTNLFNTYLEIMANKKTLKNNKTKKLLYNYDNSGFASILIITLILIGLLLYFI